MIDSSHANSQKDFSKQKNVVRDIQNQIVNGNQAICGLMIESNLVEGRQEIGNGKNLTYGQSITDACIGWNETEKLILRPITFLKKINKYENFKLRYQKKDFSKLLQDRLNIR